MFFTKSPLSLLIIRPYYLEHGFHAFSAIFTIMSSFHNVSTSCSLSFLLHVHTYSFLFFLDLLCAMVPCLPFSHLLISSVHNVLYQFSFISSYYMSPSSRISSPHIFCTIYHVFISCLRQTLRHLNLLRVHIIASFLTPPSLQCLPYHVFISRCVDQLFFIILTTRPYHLNLLSCLPLHIL